MASPKAEMTPWTRRIATNDIVSLLAPALGQEKAADVVEAALSALGLKGPLLERAEVDALLEKLAGTPGLIGIAARFAQRRGRWGEDPEPPSSVRLTARPAPRPEARELRDPNPVRTELVALFAPSLGLEKADEVVSAAAAKVGATGLLDTARARVVLEELAATPGAIGATARFARARFLLRKG